MYRIEGQRRCPANLPAAGYGHVLRIRSISPPAQAKQSHVGESHAKGTRSKVTSHWFIKLPKQSHWRCIQPKLRGHTKSESPYAKGHPASVPQLRVDSIAPSASSQRVSVPAQGIVPCASDFIRSVVAICLKKFACT